MISKYRRSILTMSPAAILLLLFSSPVVNFGIEFTRLTAQDELILEGYVFYIFTKQDGHWGLQYRSLSLY